MFTNANTHYARTHTNPLDYFISLASIAQLYRCLLLKDRCTSANRIVVHTIFVTSFLPHIVHNDPVNNSLKFCTLIEDSLTKYVACSCSPPHTPHSAFTSSFFMFSKSKSIHFERVFCFYFSSQVGVSVNLIRLWENYDETDVLWS